MFEFDLSVKAVEVITDARLDLVRNNFALVREINRLARNDFGNVILPRHVEKAAGLKKPEMTQASSVA